MTNEDRIWETVKRLGEAKKAYKKTLAAAETAQAEYLRKVEEARQKKEKSKKGIMGAISGAMSGAMLGGKIGGHFGAAAGFIGGGLVGKEIGGSAGGTDAVNALSIGASGAMNILQNQNSILANDTFARDAKTEAISSLHTSLNPAEQPVEYQPPEGHFYSDERLQMLDPEEQKWQKMRNASVEFGDMYNTPRWEG